MVEKVMDHRLIILVSLLSVFLIIFLSGPFSPIGLAFVDYNPLPDGLSSDDILPLQEPIRERQQVERPQEEQVILDVSQVVAIQEPDLNSPIVSAQSQVLEDDSQRSQSQSRSRTVRSSPLVESKVSQEISAKGAAVVLVEFDPDALEALNPSSPEKSSKVAKHQRFMRARDAVLQEVASVQSAPGVVELEESFANVPIIALRLDAQGLQTLSEIPGIRKVQADKSMTLLTAESLPLIKAPLAWNVSVNGSFIDGAGQSVCVLDTGVELSHPAFSNRLLAGFDFVDGDADPSDANGHGTHVAGIVASTSPASTIIPVRVCSNDGQCLSSNVIAGIDFCLNASSTGVNVSAISGSFGDSGVYDNTSCPTTIDSALFAAYNASVLSVFAAGNDGSSAGVTYPACSPYSIAVGAVDKEGNIASFSDRGPGLDILAPGVSVNSTLPGSSSGVRSGTSVSAPFVSGGVALLKHFAGLSGLTYGSFRVVSALVQGGSNTTGWPMLDVEHAIELFPSMPESPALPPESSDGGPTGFSILAAPVVARVNITPFEPNRSQSVAGVWNLTDADNNPENGSTWTWFINGTEAFQDSSLVGYWRLDQNFRDYLGISNGTSPSDTATPRNTTGIIRFGMDFNGTTQYLNFSNASRLAPSSQVTVGMWLNQKDLTSSMGILNAAKAFSTGSTDTRYRIEFSSVVGWSFNVPNAGFVTASYNPPAEFRNQWHHVVGRYDGANVSIFVDGVHAASTTRTGSLNNPSGWDLIVGKENVGIDILYNGSMDEIKIWNRSLSAGEIENEFQMMEYGSTEKEAANGTPAPDIPVAMWHFEDDPSDNRAEDYFGDHNGTLVGGPQFSEGVFGTTAINFDGSNDVINSSDFSEITETTNALTIILRMNPDVVTGERSLVTKWIHTTQATWYLEQNADEIRFFIANALTDTGGGSFVDTTQANLATGSWQHLAAVYDGAQATTANRIRVYVNGVNQTLTFPASISADLTDSTAPVLIGGDPVLGRFFDGRLDEVEVHTRAFSQQEVNQSFRRSYPLFGLNTSAYPSGSGFNLTFQVEPIQSDGEQGTAVNSSVVHVEQCGTVTRDTRLVTDISGQGNCFTLGANGITLDCGGFYVRGAGTGSLVNNSQNIANVTIQNCQFANATFAVDMRNVTNLVMFNNNFSGSSIRIIQNSTLAQNAVIAFNFNLSNVTLNNTINTTLENNTFQNLVVNQSGPADGAILSESNRIINNTIQNGKTILHDKGFRFERNLVINQTGFNFTGSSGLFFNNTFLNVTFEATRGGFGANSRLIDNSFIDNRTSGGNCVSFVGTSVTALTVQNVTLGNNTMRECSILFSNSANITLRDNTMDINRTELSRSAGIRLVQSSVVLIQNSTIWMQTGASSSPIIQLSTTSNITIANSTVTNPNASSSGWGVELVLGNFTVIADSKIQGANFAIRINPTSGFVSNSHFTNNIFSHLPGAITACVVIDSASVGDTNGTEIRGNIFNCSSAIDMARSSSMEVNDVNITDNFFRNGSIRVSNTFNISRVRITNNSMTNAMFTSGGFRYMIDVIGTRDSIIANNTFSNASVILKVPHGVSNITIADNVFANASVGINLSGGVGIFISNATFNQVDNPLVITNAFNATINKTKAPAGVRIESSPHGFINFTGSINFTRNQSLMFIVNVSNNTASVNTTLSPELNASAIIRLNASGYSKPIIMFDPFGDGSREACPLTRCQNLTFATGFFTFNVTGFTDYSLQDNITPVAFPVNITPFFVNSTTAVAGVWNYSDPNSDRENGTTWTWFINNTEGWRLTGPVGYWKLDQNGVDMTGVHSGNINGTVINSSGVIKSGLNFSGDGFVNVSDSADWTFTENFTISAWGLLDTIASGGMVAQGTDGNNYWYFGFVTGANEGLQFYGQQGGATAWDIQRASTDGVLTNKWYYFAVTRDRNKFTLYMDGVNVTAQDDATAFTDLASNLRIGATDRSGDIFSAGSDNAWNGFLDDVKIFNRSLSSAEIANEYQMMFYGSTEKGPLPAGTPAPDIPVAAWHFDDDPSATSAFDYFGDNQARISNATRTQGAFGTNGFSFNGVNATLIVNYSQTLNLTQNLTWMLMVTANDTKNGMYLISKSLGQSVSWGLNTDPGTYRCFLTNGTANTNAAFSVAPPHTNMHLACVYNTTALTIYANGTPMATGASIGKINITNDPLFIGSMTGSSSLYNGTIDEVEIYDRALTADEINQSYRRQFPLFGLNSSAFGSQAALTFQVEPIQTDGTVGSAQDSTTLQNSVTSCQPVSGDVTLTQDIPATGNCFTLAGDGITFDCNGFFVRGSTTGSLINSSRSLNGITIRNCQLANATFGVDLFNVSNLVVVNNNFSGTGLRIIQNSSIAQNSLISFNFNLSNATFNQTVNMTFENNTLGSLFVNQSGPINVLGRSNVYRNNSFTFSRIVLHDRAFVFERNLVQNATQFNYTGSSGWFLNNTFYNISLSVPSGGSDTYFNHNYFESNNSGANVDCLSFEGAARLGLNLTFSNNTVRNCVIRFTTASNITFLDNMMFVNRTWSTVVVLRLTGVHHMYVNNLTVEAEGRSPSTIVLFAFATTFNITVANSSLSLNGTTTGGTTTATIFSYSTGPNNLTTVVNNRISGTTIMSTNNNGFDRFVTGNTILQKVPSASQALYCIDDSGTGPNFTNSVVRGNIFNCSRAYRGGGTLFNVNITDNIVNNGSFEFGYTGSGAARNVIIRNNTFLRGGVLGVSSPGAGLVLSNVQGVLVANNTFGNHSRSLFIASESALNTRPQNLTIVDNFFDNATIAIVINGSAGGIYISNASFGVVNTSMMIFNGGNVTINNTKAPGPVIIGSIGGAMVNFTRQVNFTGNASLAQAANVTNNTVNVNASLEPGYNLSGSIVRFNTTAIRTGGPRARRALNNSPLFEDCFPSNCTIMSQAGGFFSYNVSSFSSYSFGEAYPNLTSVNITPFSVNSTTAVAGVWNYTDLDNNTENGTTWTWFIDGEEGWRDSELVWYTRLEGNGLDVLGRNNGTISGTVFNTTGIVKGAVNFSGTSSTVNDIGNGTTFNFIQNTGNFTLITWLRTSDFSDATERPAISNILTSAEKGFYLSYDNDPPPSTYSFVMANGAGVNGRVDSSTSILADNNWHHVAVTGNATNLTLFFDGARNAEGSITAFSTGNSTHLVRIAGFPGSTTSWKGSIDEVKIFNRTLTVAEIANEYHMMFYGSTEKEKTGTPAPDVPVAAWHFDDDLSVTSAFDFFGDHVAQTNTDEPSQVEGIFGTKARSFNGINETMNASHTQALNLTGNLTWLLWVRKHPSPSTQHVLGKTLGTTTGEVTFHVRLASSTVCSVYNRTSFSQAAASVGIGDTWSHVACVYNTTGLFLYINGSLRASGPYAGALNVSSHPLLFGNNHVRNFPFNGTMDEVEIYNRPLTAEEINQSYRRSFPLFGLNASTVASASTLTFQVEPIQADGTAGSAQNSSTLSLPITQCGSISASAALAQDIPAIGNCFTITNDDVTFDCAGFYIRGDTTGSLINTSRTLTGVTIKNCQFANATFGIDVTNVTNLIVFNNNFSRTGIRVIQNNSLAQDTIISFNFNVSNISLRGFHNTTVENNTMAALVATAGGSPSLLSVSNRYINNTIDFNTSTITDSLFLFERNRVLNSSLTITAIGAIINNNSFNGSQLSASAPTGSAGNHLILRNTFANNLSRSSAICFGGSSNFTFANNSLVECGLSLSSLENITFRDNIVMSNVSETGTTGLLLLRNLRNVLIHNLTVRSNATTTLVALTGGNNITLANSTIQETPSQGGKTSQVVSIGSFNADLGSNYTIADSTIIGGNSVSIDMQSGGTTNRQLNTRITNNYLENDATACIILRNWQTGLNYTVISGNRFNCTTAIDLATGSSNSRVWFINVTDNIIFNGSITIASSTEAVFGLNFLNNTILQPGSSNPLSIFNVSNSLIANNTIANATRVGSTRTGIFVHQRAENITLIDNHIANASIGLNLSGGNGVLVSNVSFNSVSNALVLTNALNVTINNTKTPNNTIVQEFGAGVFRLSVNFTGEVNFTRNQSLGLILNLSNNTVRLNSTLSPELNVSAILRFNQSGFRGPRPTIDRAQNGPFVTCFPDNCTILSSTTGFFVFNVTSFTGYEMEHALPVAERVNITPFEPDETTAIAGVWNFTSNDSLAENGTTYTWFINNTEAWRDNNLLGYFHLDDGDVNDSLGLATGAGNFTIISGLIRSAMYFNATNGSGIVLSNLSRFNVSTANALTITAWINARHFHGKNHTDGILRDTTVVGKYSGGTEFDYALKVINDSLVGFLWTGGSNTERRANGTSILPNSTWLHLAMTYNGTNLTIFVNGVRDGVQGGITGGIQGRNVPLTIARNSRTANDGPGHFNGTIDEVKIFNRSLSEAEVVNEYQMMLYGSTEKSPQNGTPAWDIPVAAWHFDDDSTATSAFDYFGDNQARVSNATKGVGAFGTGAYTFNGINSTLISNFSQTMNLSENFTYSSWVSFNTSRDSAAYLISKGSGNGAGTFNLQLQTDNTGYCQVFNDTNNRFAGTVVPPDGGFHYLTCVYNSTNIAMYLDGRFGASAGTVAPLVVNTQRLFIGSQATNGGVFNGSIDEVEIYNRALTANEINQSYRRQFPLFGLNSSRFGPGTNMTFQITPTQYDGVEGYSSNSSTVVIASPNNAPNLTNVNFTPSRPNNTMAVAGSWNYTDYENDPENGTTWTWFVDGEPGWKEHELRLYLRMDKNVSGNLLDLSSYGNNATINGSTPSTNGVVGGSYNFDGVDDNLNLSDAGNYFDSFDNATVMFWVNPDTFATDGACNGGNCDFIMFKYDFVFYVSILANASIESSWGTGANWGSTTKTTSAKNISANRWTHVAVVKNSSIIQYFFDGDLDAQKNDDAGSVGNSATGLRIGHHPAGGAAAGFFDGKLDELKFLNRSLTPSEIANEYQMMFYGSTEKDRTQGTPAQDIPVAAWSFNEPVGLAVPAPEFFGDITTSISSALSTEGVFGTRGLRFDGDGDVASASFSQPLNITTNAVTLMMWFKADAFHNDSDNLSGLYSQTSGNQILNLRLGGNIDPGFTDIGAFDKVAFTISNGSIFGQIRNQSRSRISTGSFYHAAVSYNGTRAKLYINGSLEVDEPFTGGVIFGDSGHEIGRDNGQSGTTFNGTIDEVYLFDRALSADEINQSFRRSFPLFGINSSFLSAGSTIRLQVEPIQMDGTAGNASNSTSAVVQPITTCQNITGITHIGGNLTINDSPCLSFQVNHSIVDCQGFFVTGNGTSKALINLSSIVNTTFRDCHFQNATFAFDIFDSSAFIFNNTFGGTGIRIVQNESQPEEVIISSAINLSNLTIFNGNVSVENSSFSNLFMLPTGTFIFSIGANRFVGNNITNGETDINDTKFRFVSNIIQNQTRFTVTMADSFITNPFGGLFLANTFRNTSINATGGDFVRDVLFLANSFDTNGTTNGICLNLQSTTNGNLTLANNTLIECGISLTGANHTLRDNRIDINRSTESPTAIVTLTSATNVLADNLDIVSFSETPTGLSGILPSGSITNLTIANATIEMNGPTTPRGILMANANVNDSLIADSVIRSAGFGILLPQQGAVSVNNRITGNTILGNTSSPCLRLGGSPHGPNLTVIRGNTFNCSVALEPLTTGSDIRISDMNVTDNTIINGSVMFTSNVVVNKLVFANNTLSSPPRTGTLSLLISNTTRSLVFNNTFNNRSVAIEIGPDAENVTMRDNVVANSSVGLNLSGGSGVHVSNITFAAVDNPLILSNAFNATVNNTRASRHVVIESRGGASINFTAQVNFTKNVTLHFVVNVSQGRAFVNSTLSPELNASAILRLNASGSTSPNPAVDQDDDGTFERCQAPRCTQSSTSGEFLIFNVSMFTTYGIANGTSCGFVNTNVTMEQDLAATGVCFIINGSDSFVDCAGFEIRGNTSDPLINSSNTLRGVTIRNCNFANSTFGIGLRNVSDLLIFNNNFSQTGLRLIQNSSLAQNTTIVFNFNLSNVSFNNTINTTFENNTARNLFVNQSGPRNRYVNNSVIDGAIFLHDSSFLMERNVFRNMTNFSIAGSTGTYLNNSFFNVTIEGNYSGLAINSKFIFNYFYYNISNNPRCISFVSGGTSDVNLTLANNTFQDCTIRLQPAINLTIRDDRIFRNGTAGPDMVELNTVRDVFIHNLTIILNTTSDPNLIEFTNTTNLTLANLTIIQVRSSSGGNHGVVLFSGSSRVLIADSRISTPQRAIRFSDANETRVTGNVIFTSGSGLNACINLESPSINATEIQGNDFNCSNAAIFFGGGSRIVDFNMTDNRIFNGSVQPYSVGSIRFAKNVRITNNTFMSPGSTGIFIALVNTSESLIANNTFNNATIAIQLVKDSHNLTIADNVFENSSIGINMSGGTGVFISNASFQSVVIPLVVTNSPFPTINNTRAPSGVIIQSSDNATLNFTSGINFTINQSFISYINITNNSVYINTTLSPELNASAIITLRAINRTFPIPHVRFQDGGSIRYCPPSICRNISYSIATGLFVFNVTHFTEFGASENDTIPPTVYDAELNGTKIPANTPFNFTMNVTDNYSVDKVRGNLTSPSGSFSTFNFSFLIGDVYNISINQTSEFGNYTLWVLANDSNTNRNHTERFQFEVVAPNISIKPVSISCSQTATVQDQVICSVIARHPDTGVFLESLIIGFNVSNATGSVLIVGNATDIGSGNYRVNFSVPRAGGFIVAVQRQNTNYAASTSTMVRGGFGKSEIFASGTLYFPESKVVVDALFLDADGQPISQAGCNLTLVDQNQSVILENGTMAQFAFGGIPHYVFNRTNISVISANMTDGAYFGHVRCQQPGTSGITTFGRVSFEVRRFNISSTSGGSTDNTPVLNSINDTRTLLNNLLERQGEFSQEEVFLVTDAFNQMSDLSASLIQGTATPQEVVETLSRINQSLSTKLGDRFAQVSSAPLGRSAVSVESDSVRLADIQSVQPVLEGFMLVLVVFVFGSLGWGVWKKVKGV